MLLEQKQTQKLAITASMRQSLHMLELPVSSLGEYLEELSYENVLVEVERSPAVRQEAEPYIERRAPKLLQPEDQDYAAGIADTATLEESFVEHLLRQLEADATIPAGWLPRCRFIVESLNDRGYLDEPIELLAEAMGISEDDAIQALYVVQMLSPTGVGARDLKECLTIQLAEGSDFNTFTLRIVSDCLELLARGKIAAIARELGTDESTAEQYCSVIRSLNPIPSRGFKTAAQSVYVVPEAVVEISGGELSVQYNGQQVPSIAINAEYMQMLGSAESPELKEYLKSRLQQANSVKQALESRQSTLRRVIGCILELQRDYVLGRAQEPAAVTLQELADTLELHVSTVSRAVKDKYITLPTGTVLLKSLCQAQVSERVGMSRAAVISKLKLLMDRESKPLSDEKLRLALAAMGIEISRRTVAAYRQELGYPSAAERKKLT